MTQAARKKIAAGLRWVLPAGVLRRFVRQEDGATAIEFAFVALPFLALTFAILETALVFFAGQTLEAAAADSGRLIMTGQAQTGRFDKAAFKKQVCDHIAGLFDCTNSVYVDVRTYSSSSSNSAFSNAATSLTTSPIQSGKFDSTKVQYNPGGPGDIVVVTLYYEWPIYLSLLGNHLDNLDGSKRLLVATSVFKNEPY
ncbi:MAG: pilus assembly protein [Pseudolabrys sp.]|jgi:Flp pilus assembly protein TadG